MTNEVTLKEKIGQMLLMGFEGDVLHPNHPIVQAISAQQIGGVVLFDYNFQTQTYDRNIKNPEQLKRLIAQLQSYTKEAAPLFIAIDYEGGKVNRLKEQNGFPKTLSAAEVGQLSFEEMRVYAEQMAVTLHDLGINMNFAPVVDVNLNPDNPIIGFLARSFSSDAQRVMDCAALFVKAHQIHGVHCVYKHFPGHGSSTGDTHIGFVDVTQVWQACELDPYKVCHSPMVMTAHVVHCGFDLQGYPASLSYEMTTKLLREKLNFTGVVVTDDMQMKAITDNYDVAEAVRLAVNAGADILVFGNQLTPVPQDPQQIIDLIYSDVLAGRIIESRIDEAYRRIMQLKQVDIKRKASQS